MRSGGTTSAGGDRHGQLRAKRCDGGACLGFGVLMAQGEKLFARSAGDMRF
jgi:hypothetical protein